MSGMNLVTQRETPSFPGAQKRREGRNKVMKKILFRVVISVSLFYAGQLQALDFATATGLDIVNENAAKEQGYSSAQLETLQERLAGRTLTFENGKVFSVSKGFDGKLSVKISFEAEKSKGFFASTFSVDAKVSDPATAKWAENLDKGAKIKRLTGKVDRKGAVVMFFTLVDAEIELDK